MEGDHVDQLAVVARDAADASVAERQGVLDDRIEHRLDVGRRLRDDLQDLGRRRLLLERLAELGGALLNLALPGRCTTRAAPPPSC